MKTKNVLLATLAFVFAVGSAFASLFTARDIFVKAKLSSAPGAPTQCINAQVKCDDSGSSTCTVNIQLRSGANAQASTTGPVYTFDATPCVTLLDNTSVTAVNSPLAGDDRPVSLVQGNP